MRVEQRPVKTATVITLSTDDWTDVDRQGSLVEVTIGGTDDGDVYVIAMSPSVAEFTARAMLNWAETVSRSGVAFERDAS